MSDLKDAVEQAKGSLDVLDTLLEEFGEWLDEANGDAERETLENVINHLEAMNREYGKRRREAEKQLAAQQGAS